MTPTPIFAKIMELTNARAYQVALDACAIPPNGALMEIGFGSGKLLALARQRWPNVALAGVDPTSAMVDMAVARAEFKSGSAPDLRRGEAATLPWPNQSFDAIICVHAFQFWQPPAQSAAQIRRVLKPGGCLVLVIRDHRRHAPEWLPNPISRSGREMQGACDLLSHTGFEVRAPTEGGKIQLSVATAPA